VFENAHLFFLLCVKRVICLQEKKAVREEKLKHEEKYMWAVVDGVKEKVLFLYCDFLPP
jgi:hypothetical protein